MDNNKSFGQTEEVGMEEKKDLQDLEELYEEDDIASDEGSKEVEDKSSKMKGIWSDIIFFGILIIVSVYIIPTFVLQRTIVDGSSMQYTLEDGDQLYVEKITYRLDKLERFDIIVFYPYGRESDEYYVKRIIGLPGETIQIIDGAIFINGELLKEDYGKEVMVDSGRAADPIYVGEDEYFVLGDNRNSSKDSRQPSVGNIAKKNIGGKVFLRIQPFNKFGFID